MSSEMRFSISAVCASSLDWIGSCKDSDDGALRNQCLAASLVISTRLVVLCRSFWWKDYGISTSRNTSFFAMDLFGGKIGKLRNSYLFARLFDLWYVVSFEGLYSSGVGQPCLGDSETIKRSP